MQPWNIRPIETAHWDKTATQKFDNLKDSWITYRQKLKSDGGEAYESFINQLKRKHSIETGIIEQLYNISQGLTQTFIQEGFTKEAISHGDTDIHEDELISVLTDHQDAINYLYEINEDELSIRLIRNLHEMVCAHQSHFDAINSLGETVRVKLHKGSWKENDNNPSDAGNKKIYCPATLVGVQINSMVEVYNKIAHDVHPIFQAAWLHHSFAAIHPFQDGNGRVARLLGSLSLIREKLLPFTVDRSRKKEYIESLREADQGDYTKLVKFISDQQSREITYILNKEPEAKVGTKTFNDLAELFNTGLAKDLRKKESDRVNAINEKRESFFTIVSGQMDDFYKRLKDKISQEYSISNMASPITDILDEPRKSYKWKDQLVKNYARRNDYFFNYNYPRYWYGLSFRHGTAEVRLAISVHHYGYEDSTLAITTVLEHYIPNKDNDGRNYENYEELEIKYVEPRLYSIGKDAVINESNIQQDVEELAIIGVTAVYQHLSSTFA